MSQASAKVDRVARTVVEDWVLENDHLRLTLLSDSLALTAEEKATGTRWSADLWQGSAGRLILRSRAGDTLSVDLAAAREKQIESLSAADGSSGLRLVLSQFRSRLGPVRRDRSIEPHVTLELQVGLAADRPEFVCRVERLENTSRYWQLQTLEWPLRLFPVRTLDDDGYVAVPQEQGFIIPSRFGDVGHFRYLNWVWDRIAGHAMVLENTSMPWFGAKKGDSAFLCVLETMDDAAIGVIGNDVRTPDAPPAAPSAAPVVGAALHAPRLSAVWPLWRASKGKLGYPRIARYTFLPRGGYVEMCKTYRQHAQQSGRFVTLRQKIEQNPNVEKLIGAPHIEVQLVANHPRQPEYQGLSGAIYDGYHHVNTTFAQAEAMVRDLHDRLHVDRAVLLLAGWGNAGYDNYRPIDTWPPNAEAGGAEGLRQAIAVAKEAGYLVGLFDNYRNLDVVSPSYDDNYIVREADGSLSIGFSSEGGHSGQICTVEAVNLHRRNMERFTAELGPNAHYLDTVGGLPFFECYDPNHPATRSQDREAKGALMRVATDAGLVLGVEGQPRDWNLPIAAFYEEHPVRLGIDVPLYHLVYHECAVLYWQHGMPYNYGLDNYGHVRGTLLTKLLRGLLYGDPPSWVFTDRSYHAWRETFKEVNDIVAAHHRRVAHDELVAHRILTPDLLVQRTRFSSGVEVTVNYGEFPYLLESGAELPAHGFKVTDESPRGASFAGQIKLEITAHPDE